MNNNLKLNQKLGYVVLFPAGTMESAAEKKKMVSAVSETLKKGRNFFELKIRYLKKKFSQML